ncbi:UNVERIFIED_CONTAM: Beta-amylase 2, chloroplastic [Sesamum latifolium]|uniref:Beta-amylase n=1 Tax=Sesamum latifolium TaxID=2727402 RepID=A0AAW2WCL9_9LAMI
MLLQIEVQRREVLNSGAPSRTMVRCSAKKFADGIATSENQQEVHEQDSTNTPIVPVYVMLPGLTLSILSGKTWKYPGIGEFQFYNKYLRKNLEDATKVRGKEFCGRKPEGICSYNSKPHDTKLFCHGGILTSTKVSEYSEHIFSIEELKSHVAELTARFYNGSRQDGNVLILLMLKKYKTALNFTCVELQIEDQCEEFREVLADPEQLVWQVLNDAWDVGIPLGAENALPCYGRQGFNKILQNAKPYGTPDKRHLSTFTYLRLSPDLMEEHNLREFE